jgi:hypothetical protein
MGVFANGEWSREAGANGERPLPSPMRSERSRGDPFFAFTQGAGPPALGASGPCPGLV